KVGWGHSSVEYAVKIGQFARTKKVALSHHDPLRDDDAIDRLVARARAKLRQSSSSLDVFAASEGQIVDVSSSLQNHSGTKAHHPGGPSCSKASSACGANASIAIGQSSTTCEALARGGVRSTGGPRLCGASRGYVTRSATPGSKFLTPCSGSFPRSRAAALGPT